MWSPMKTVVVAPVWSRTLSVAPITMSCLPSPVKSAATRDFPYAAEAAGPSAAVLPVAKPVAEPWMTATVPAVGALAGHVLAGGADHEVRVAVAVHVGGGDGGAEPVAGLRGAGDMRRWPG